MAEKNQRSTQIDKLVEFFRKTTYSLGEGEIDKIRMAEEYLKAVDWNVDQAAEEHELLIDRTRRSHLSERKKRRYNLDSDGGFSDLEP